MSWIGLETVFSRRSFRLDHPERLAAPLVPPAILPPQVTRPHPGTSALRPSARKKRRNLTLLLAVSPPHVAEMGTLYRLQRQEFFVSVTLGIREREYGSPPGGLPLGAWGIVTCTLTVCCGADKALHRAASSWWRWICTEGDASEIQVKSPGW